MLANTWRPSGTWAMPKWARSAGGTDSKSWSSNRMRPPRGRTVPEMALNRVVLPAPLGPTIDTNCPARTARETSASAGRPPEATVRPSTASTDRRPFLAEIRLDHAFVLDDLAGVTDREDRAMIEHDEALGQPHHRAHGVLDDHDRGALRGKRADHLEHVLDFVAGKSGERLVHQHEARLPGERAR